MRRILVNRARDKRRLKRGGGRERVDLEDIAIADPVGALDLLALDEALEGLAREEPACAELVKLRFFAGLTQEESAAGARRDAADRRPLLGVRPRLAPPGARRGREAG